MYSDRIGTGLSIALGAITAVLAVVGIVAEPGVLLLALVFAAATALVYYHASGLMAARLYRKVERRAAAGRSDRQRARRGGETGAGPRPDWTPPRGGATARDAAAGNQRRRRTTRGRRRTQSTTPPGTSAHDLSATEAYRRLDLEPGVDEGEIKRAYREKVKEVHPDAESGDERTFKAVTAAYERLTE